METLPATNTSFIWETVRMVGLFSLFIIPSNLSKRVLCADRNNLHIAEWLFTKVSAVVHHGGAGTTACGLSNGRPTIIVPFFGEYDHPPQVLQN